MGIKFFTHIDRGVLHTHQHVPGLRFIVRSGIKFLTHMGRGVLHTTQHVSGGSIISPWSWTFVGRMQYAPTRTIQSLPIIEFNKYIFIKHLYRMGRGVLHTPQHVPGESIICPWSWEFVGRMQYAPTRTIQSFSGIRFNKYVFNTYLSRMGTTESICYRSLPRFWFISLTASGYTYRLWV